MKVTFRLPSKAVQYGHIEVEMDSMGLSPEALGEMYAKHVKGFWAGEKDARPKPPDSDAIKQFEEQLGAKKISEEPNENSSTPPWKAEPQAPATKPWQKKPDLFG